jgi:hypothetical protein
MSKRKAQPLSKQSHKQSKMDFFLEGSRPKEQTICSAATTSTTQLRPFDSKPPPSQPITSNSSNAFHALMKAARDAVPRKETFVFQEGRDGQDGYMWSWLWETTESPNETAHTEKHNSNISCGTTPVSQVLLGWNGFQTLKRQSESGASGSSLVNLRTNIHSVYPHMIPQTKLTASVLKSAMQKNVRLCRPTNAVVVGRELQRNSMMEFLRRLAIIILEDAILHPALPLVVWTLIAHSQKDEHQFHPPPQLASALLAIVADIARVGVRDPLGHDVAPVTEEEMRRLRGPEQVAARHTACPRRMS